ncbi:MAG: DivIVA domain-containing protein [Tyzzerella sp.]|uniref:DivIVA domain-containing protein n=1 Tax=Candidatus Fimicola merdigallinarum TaxID=2840819 RepID=A0A9D9DUW6_9FIRM|nr:DivIVA domain-containing protein [Candidatus Fimicola merdigallinarum]
MITVNDIETKEFKKSALGYSQDDVDKFLDEIIVDYEKLTKENFELKEKVASLSDSVNSYRSIEKSLQTTLALAEETAQKTVKNAEEEKEKIISETRKQADNYLAQAKEKADSILAQANEKYDSVFGDTDKKLAEAQRNLDRLLERYEATKKRLKVIFEAEIRLLDKNDDSYIESDIENY